MKNNLSINKAAKFLSCLLCSVYYCTFLLWDSKTRIVKYMILVLLLIGVLAELARIVRSRKPSVRDNVIILLFGLLEMIFLIYALAAGNSAQRITALYQYNFYLLLLCAAFFYVDENFYKILGLLRYMGCVLAVLAVYEFTSRSYIIPAGNEWYGMISFGGVWLIRSRVFSGSPMVFGLIMSLLTIVAFDYYRRKKCLLNLIITLMNLIGVLLSASRGPYVSLAVGIFFYYLFESRNRRQLLKVSFRVLVFFILIAVLINTLSPSNSIIAYIQARFQSIFQWAGKSGQIWSSNTTRMKLWRNAVHMLFSGTNWIYGIGAAATGARSLEFGGFVTESGVLRRFVEFGVFIGIIYYIFLFRLIRYGYRNAKRNYSNHIGLAIGLISCILLEDTILQITEEISITLFLWLSIVFLIKSNEKSTISIKEQNNRDHANT